MQKGGFGSTVEDFERLGAEIAEMPDPAQRTARAMEIFGKAGTKLIPMFNGLRDAKDSAKQMGLVFSREDAESADTLGDTLDALMGTAKMAVAVLGSALAPTIVDLAKQAIGWVSTGASWLKQNPGIILSALKLAGVVAGLGAGLFVLGQAITLVGTVLAGLTGAVTFLLSPLGLVLAGTVGLTAAWFTLTESGQAAWGELSQIATSSMGGILDALMTGDLALAGDIAFTGLVAAAKTVWGQFSSWWSSVWDKAVITVAVALNDVTAALQQTLRKLADNPLAKLLMPGLSFGASLLDLGSAEDIEKRRASTEVALLSDLNKSPSGGPDVPERAELAALLAKAAEKRAAQANQISKAADPKNGGPTVQGLQGSDRTGGTFNAAAVAALGASSIQQQQLDTQKRIADGIDKLNLKEEDVAFELS